MADTVTIDLHPDKERGTLDLCPHQGCGFRCCEFNQGNYIVLYPGEWEEAAGAGRSLAHLEVIDADYHGGKKAVCHAWETATCDDGYKPLDCATYPFFPKAGLKQDAVAGLIKGSKCPIEAVQIPAHAAWVRGVWNRLIEERPQTAEWLRYVTLVGYENVE